MSELLVALSDAQGRKDTSILNAFAKFEEAAKAFVSAVRNVEKEADFWEIALKTWMDYHDEKSHVPFEQRKRLALNLIDQSPRRFPDPKRARDFLTCPRLSEDKIARLITGIEKPSNKYEIFAAKQKSPDLQKVIIRAEKKDWLAFRLSELRREAGEPNTVSKSYDLAKGEMGNELLVLDDLLAGGFKEQWVTLDRVWRFVRYVLPPGDSDLEQTAGLDHKERFRVLKEQTAAFRERIGLVAEMEPRKKGAPLSFILKPPGG